MPDPKLFMSNLHAIEADWIDYNNHLNMGYNTVLFDRGADEAYAVLGFGPDYAEERGLTTYTAEFHIRYMRELKLGDKVRIAFRIVDHDEKRFHSYQEMYHEDGWMAATGESMVLHVDMSGPKVAPMPVDILNNVKAMARTQSDMPQPEAVGAAISLRRMR
ncbi:thioesterase family protein [Roseovarius rhodophyticola]|uniref:Thioesterase family protein n=1 Tax=Roseovarius rhodophyticola TaxID=3080827 RepID=A0ABZ2TGT2_9RHOB|nr:thioesterase family protein [Roseovarius sp. W115]MDV2929217.1 thioesterase family protein [Roseovarius sp. W115]